MSINIPWIERGEDSFNESDLARAAVEHLKRGGCEECRQWSDGDDDFMRQFAVLCAAGSMTGRDPASYDDVRMPDFTAVDDLVNAALAPPAVPEGAEQP